MNFNIKECYDNLGISEKWGIKFGLLPASLQGLSRDDINELMSYDRYVRNYNKQKEILDEN